MSDRPTLREELDRCAKAYHHELQENERLRAENKHLESIRDAKLEDLRQWYYGLKEAGPHSAYEESLLVLLREARTWLEPGFTPPKEAMDSLIKRIDQALGENK